MIDSVYVWDDILSKDKQLYLIEYVKRENIKWENLKSITYGERAKHEFPAKVHQEIYCTDELIKNINKEIQLNISERLGLFFVTNYRWKINWTCSLKHEYDPINMIHRDRANEHIAAVYYINDTTGDTSIYNHKLGNNGESYISNPDDINFDDYVLLNNVSPKMGRCVVFNGNLAHHGTYPITGDRWIINFNFVAKQNNKSLI